MPNRIIKESVCTSDSVDRLSWFEEVFFYRLIVNCDDYGRFDARPSVLKARLFPLKERITLREVSSALTQLASIGIVRLYECDSKPYLYLPTWEVHQTIRAKKSKYPAPDESVKSSEIICKQMQADVAVIQSNPNPNPNPNPKNAQDAFVDFSKDNEDLLKALRDYEAMRKQIKKPMTDRAKGILLTALDKYPNNEWIDMLNAAIMHNWLSVYPLKQSPKTEQKDRNTSYNLDEFEKLAASGDFMDQ